MANRPSSRRIEAGKALMRSIENDPTQQAKLEAVRRRLTLFGLTLDQLKQDPEYSRLDSKVRVARDELSQCFHDLFLEFDTRLQTAGLEEIGRGLELPGRDLDKWSKLEDFALMIEGRSILSDGGFSFEEIVRVNEAYLRRALPAAGRKDVSKHTCKKQPGRRKRGYETIQKESKQVAEWVRAKEAGVYKADFAEQKGMSLKNFEQLQDRVYRDKRRADN